MVDDLRDELLVDDAGALKDIDYEPAFGDLITSLQKVPSYPSLDPGADPTGRVLRSSVYLMTAAANGMDYFPDFDRAPFVSAVVRRLYQSLPMKLYNRVAAALVEGSPDEGNGEEIVSEWTTDITLPIPPITALVLKRAGSVEEIPLRLLEVRAEFVAYRKHFRGFKADLRAADTLKERRRLREKYVKLLDAASGPDAELISAGEVVNLAERTIKAASAPLLPTSYSAQLLTQPADWLRRWWLRRPLTVLFRLDGKLPRLSEYRELIARLWGQDIEDRVLSEVAAHGRQVATVMHQFVGHED